MVYLPAFGIEAPLLARIRMMEKQLPMPFGPRGAASVNHKQAPRSEYRFVTARSY
jgi:hypothetical protein